MLIILLIGYSCTITKIAYIFEDTIQAQQVKIKTLTQQNEEISSLAATIMDAKSNSFIHFTESDLQKDINETYKFLSKRDQDIIIKTIIEESHKYKINPLVLYSLIHTESSMRPWIEHSKVLIQIKDKRQYIRAVGLGGIVWEWWSKQLKTNHIAATRADLFNPKINIQATAYIYNSFYKMKKLKKASTQDESAMIRYFGGGYKSYFLKIDKKVSSMVCKHIYRIKKQ